ncbi:MAG TPA: N-acetylglucosamine-6-phosphate deacetylase [Firmicutes bacterium]|nr:N-acetylglucosamine-6-phosphate deacetylase [Candidatus Fermentithermobacillaceae bacterium]
MFALKAKTLVTPYRVIEDGVVVVDGEQIKYVGSSQNVCIPEGCEVTDLGDKILAPGCIDIHHHGAVGCRAWTAEGVKKIGAFLPSTGCTSWLPTVNDAEHCRQIMQAKREGTGGADIAGIHMEGPFLAPKNLPGKPEVDAHLRKPDLKLLEQIQEAAEGNVLLMGVGIEVEGALELIRGMRRLGIVPSVAHTKTDYATFMKAVDAGLRHATHLYNVMTGLHHRRPNVVGGVLTCDEVTTELIGDGFHVHPVAMDIAIRCKGVGKIALITDQSELAGLPDGRYERPNGVAIIKKDGICRMEGFDEKTDNTMAGSSLTIDHNVRTMVNKVGLSLKEVFTMAALTPATIVGINKTKGSLEPGKDADIVVWSKDLVVEAAYVKGQKRYSR